MIVLLVLTIWLAWKLLTKKINEVRWILANRDNWVLPLNEKRIMRVCFSEMKMYLYTNQAHPVLLTVSRVNRDVKYYELHQKLAISANAPDLKKVSRWTLYDEEKKDWTFIKSTLDDSIEAHYQESYG